MSESDVRVPPQSLEAEQAVLGAMLLSGSACDEALKLLKFDDFYREVHRIIFGTCLSIRERKEPVDMITISEALKKSGDLERVGGITWLSALVEKTPTSANVAYYCGIVREKRMARGLITAATRIVSDTYKDNKRISELLHDAHHIMKRALESAATFKDYDDSLKTLSAKVLAMVKANFEGTEDRFIKTGFERFDRIIGGLERGKIILITGDAGIGKSVLVQQMAIQIAKENIEVGMACLDVGKEEIPLRMVCNTAGVEYRDLFSQDPEVMTPAKWEDVETAFKLMEYIDTLHIVGQEDISQSLDNFEDWARHQVKEHGLKVIFVDSAAKFEMDEMRDGNMERAHTKLANRLNTIAIDLNVTMVVIHETNAADAKTPKYSKSWTHVIRYWFELNRDDKDRRNIKMKVRKNSNNVAGIELPFVQNQHFHLKEV